MKEMPTTIGELIIWMDDYVTERDFEKENVMEFINHLGAIFVVDPAHDEYLMSGKTPILASSKNDYENILFIETLINFFYSGEEDHFEIEHYHLKILCSASSWLLDEEIKANIHNYLRVKASFVKIKALCVKYNFKPRLDIEGHIFENSFSDIFEEAINDPKVVGLSKKVILGLQVWLEDELGRFDEISFSFLFTSYLELIELMLINKLPLNLDYLRKPNKSLTHKYERFNAEYEILKEEGDFVDRTELEALLIPYIKLLEKLLLSVSVDTKEKKELLKNIECYDEYIDKGIVEECNKILFYDSLDEEAVVKYKILNGYIDFDADIQPTDTDVLHLKLLLKKCGPRNDLPIRDFILTKGGRSLNTNPKYEYCFAEWMYIMSKKILFNEIDALDDKNTRLRITDKDFRWYFSLGDKDAITKTPEEARNAKRRNTFTTNNSKGLYAFKPERVKCAEGRIFDFYLDKKLKVILEFNDPRKRIS